MTRQVKFCGRPEFGIIGTGAFARVHAEALRCAENAVMEAVFGTVPERAAAFCLASLER